MRITDEVRFWGGRLHRGETDGQTDGQTDGPRCYQGDVSALFQIHAQENRGGVILRRDPGLEEISVPWSPDTEAVLRVVYVQLNAGTNPGRTSLRTGPLLSPPVEVGGRACALGVWPVTPVPGKHLTVCE